MGDSDRDRFGFSQPHATLTHDSLREQNDSKKARGPARADRTIASKITQSDWPKAGYSEHPAREFASVIDQRNLFCTAGPRLRFGDGVSFDPFAGEHDDG